MIKVLAAIVVPPHLSVSGGARAAERLSVALSGHCDVHIASMMSMAPTLEDGLSHLTVQTSLPPVLPWSRVPNRYRTPFYRSDIPEMIRHGRYDLVHIHNPTPGLEMVRIARACRAARIPYVVSTHGFNEVANGRAVHGSSALMRLAWQALSYAPVSSVVRGAAAIFALSAADIPIIRAMGFAGDAVHVVPNGVPLPEPADDAADRVVWERFGLASPGPGHPITCMFLANHTPNKGLPVLLEAFRSLQRPYSLIIGGEKRQGVDYDGAVASVRPGQQVVVTGRLQDDEVPALMRRSDLFVFPTLADTLPLVLFEAMSHGLPVLASTVGGIPFQVDRRSGVLVQPGDAEALAAAVDRLADRPRLLQAMGRHARRRVLQEFTWEQAAACALTGYEAVLRAYSSARPSTVHAVQTT